MTDARCQSKLGIVVLQCRIAVGTVTDNVLDPALGEELNVFFGYFFEDELIAEPSERVAAALLLNAQNPEFHIRSLQYLCQSHGYLPGPAIERPCAADVK